ncbi:MAG: hypothetical protein HY720_11190 [Planctomycetes bacterium]|nr:hypothetical protein [Planctomycetota bacterium]
MTRTAVLFSIVFLAVGFTALDRGWHFGEAATPEPSPDPASEFLRSVKRAVAPEEEPAALEAKPTPDKAAECRCAACETDRCRDGEGKCRCAEEKERAVGSLLPVR